MTEYFLRCTEADKPNLFALALRLGVLTVSEWVPTGRKVKDQSTGEEVDEMAPARYAAAAGCTWDEIGAVNAPTGKKILQDDGVTEVDEMAPSTDKTGALYFHANLITPIPLGQIAENIYAETQDATLGAAMHDMARFFVVDPLTGLPKRPKVPFRVFA